MGVGIGASRKRGHPLGWLEDALLEELLQTDGAVTCGPAHGRVQSAWSRVGARALGFDDPIVLNADWTWAFTTPSRRIVIARCVAERLSTEAVAFILAHEIGHHASGHFDFVNRAQDPISAVLRALVRATVHRPFNREQELEADRWAASRLRHDACAAFELFDAFAMAATRSERVQRLEEAQTPLLSFADVMDTHPPINTRRRELLSYLLECTALRDGDAATNAGPYRQPGLRACAYRRNRSRACPVHEGAPIPDVGETVLRRAAEVRAHRLSSSLAFGMLITAFAIAYSELHDVSAAVGWAAIAAILGAPFAWMSVAFARDEEDRVIGSNRDAPQPPPDDRGE